MLIIDQVPLEMIPSSDGPSLVVSIRIHDDRQPAGVLLTQIPAVELMVSLEDLCQMPGPPTPVEVLECH